MQKRKKDRPELVKNILYFHAKTKLKKNIELKKVKIKKSFFLVIL
jgi:hypothetical protein